jgi:FixJ family two-component response regulator
VILTGAPDFVVTDALMRRGVTDYLLKPVSQNKLLQAVRHAVHLHQMRRKQDPA